MTTLYAIQISKEINLPSESELFAILERLLPINFVVGDQHSKNVQGIIISDVKDSKVVNKVTSLALPSNIESENTTGLVETTVKFSDELEVPFPFRGRTVKTNIVRGGGVLSLHSNEKALAANDEGVLWSVLDTDGVKKFRSVLPLPNISLEQNFNDVFNGECFIQMLVLLQFIRVVSASTHYQNAPLRAAFIIDDPNLHWPSYGFVDYREIAKRAKDENFHVAFATIPLDTWFTHKATANLFAANSQSLSLLIHGNNHAKEELAFNYSDANRKALLLQAIQRIERLETNSNLHVCKVMVPPHGACSNDMLAELPNCGFESACISSGSLRFHNKAKSWTKTLGFYPSETIEGCPVLPRWGLTGNVENTLLISAYLGQPMILRGHHQDLKGGGGKFIEFAKFINTLGDVSWLNMTGLSRLNYQWRIQGKTVWVKPLGLNTVFKPPKGVNEIIVEYPSGIDVANWHIVYADGKSCNIFRGEAFPITEEMKGEILIKRDTAKPISSSVHVNSTPPKLILRRLLTEVRDRLLLTG